MKTELTHDQIIEKLTTSFVVPTFQPMAGVHASWATQNITYRLDADLPADEKTGAREAYELWDDLIAPSITEVTSGEKIFVERNITVGTLAKHIDLINGSAAAILGGLVAAGIVTAGGGAILGGVAFETGAALVGGLIAAAAGGLWDMEITTGADTNAFSPINTTDDLDLDHDGQTTITYSSVHMGSNVTAHTPSGPIKMADNMAPGEFGFEAFVHEFGHSLGLSHPGTYNGTAPAYDDPSVYLQDTTRFSIMSYFHDETLDGSQSNWQGARPATPMLHDILAIQDKYGADTTTRTGDTVYGFNSTAGRSAFDFTVNKAPVVTIYDAGGIDTLDTSGYGVDQTIDLRLNKVGQSFKDEKFSSIGGLTNNVAIAYGVTIENAIGGTANDTILGNEADNVLSGLYGQDTLIGGDGNDALDGGPGYDSMEGGRGNDLYFVDSYGDIVHEKAPEGTDEIRLAPAISTYDLRTLDANLGYVENLTYTGNFTFTGYGNDLFNRITGGGNDDVIDGGVGADTMIGRDGNDTFYVDNGRDQVIENKNEGNDTVHSIVSFTLSDNVENLTLDGSAAINGNGNTLANVITGNDAANTLDGGGGADTLVGGMGNDTYRTNGGDTIIEAAGGGTDRVVSTAASYTLAANVENLTLAGAGTISGHGNKLGNVIEGNSGANHLYGDFGNDTLTGGAGRDYFHFDAALDPSKNLDLITDFNVVDDTIMLDTRVFTNLPPVLQPSVSSQIASAPDLSDYLAYNPANGALFYDSNGAAPGGRVEFAVLPTGLHLTLQNFQVYTS